MSDRDDDRSRMRQYGELPPMLGIKDLAELLRCSERVASDWCAENAWNPDTGAGVAFKVGRAWRVSKDALPWGPPAGSPEVDELRKENVRLRERLAALETVLASIESTAATAMDNAP